MVRNPIWWFLFLLLSIVALVWAFFYQTQWNENRLGGTSTINSSSSSTTQVVGDGNRVFPGTALYLESHQLEHVAQTNYQRRSKNEALQNLNEAIQKAEQVERNHPEYARTSGINGWLNYLRGLKSNWNNNNASVSLPQPSPKEKEPELASSKPPSRNSGLVFSDSERKSPSTQIFPPVGLFAKSKDKTAETEVKVEKPREVTELVVKRKPEPKPKPVQKETKIVPKKPLPKVKIDSYDEPDILVNSGPVIRDEPSISVPPPPPILPKSVPAPEAPDRIIMNDRNIAESTDLKFELGPEDDNAAIVWYRAYEEAELAKKYESEGDSENAVAHYRESMGWYRALVKKFPGFQTDVVKYKTLIIEEKIAQLGSSTVY